MAAPWNTTPQTVLGKFGLATIQRGTDLTEIPRAVSFCAVALNHPGDPLVIGDTLHDELFVRNPLVMAQPHARSYAGMPIRSREGLPLGTLSVVDTIPRTFTPAELRYTNSPNTSAK